MRRKLKIKKTLTPAGEMFYTIRIRKYRWGIIPCGRWETVYGTTHPFNGLSLNLKKYIDEYYQIRRMCDDHYIVYRRYYFFKWWYYAIDDHINKMFDTEEEAREAIIRSLIK